LKILYLGLSLQNFKKLENVVHFPVIKITPKEPSYIENSLQNFDKFTHLIFTSPRSVDILCTHLKASKKLFLMRSKLLIAIGASTNKALEKYQLHAIISKQATQEGIVSLLKNMNLFNCNFFIPRSSIARDALDRFFKKNKIKYHALDIYDTKVNIPDTKIDLNEFSEVVFTSPSVVKAFIQIFKKLPSNLKLTAIGPITQKALSDLGVKKS